MDPALSPMRVALVDEPEIVVRGLADMLGPDGRVVSVLGVDELAEADVVLCDTGSDPDGWHRMRRVLSRGRPVVLFSWDRHTERYPELIRHGLRGYVSKAADARTIVDVVRTVASGGLAHPRPVRGVHPADAPGGREALTEREVDVLELVLQGLSNAEIAQASFVSINTVKIHIRTAYRKMGVSSRSQAILWCIAHGFEHQDGGPRTRA
jgi:DNA-binding NarL/FixJ family response regulator